jgi:small-conductance mechanosensitive channel
LLSIAPPVKQVSRSTKTRLRFLRRLAILIVFVILAAIAIAQFTELQRLATGILASTAVLAAIIGFAAQHTIANMVAGVQLAISQPIRIGDRISFEEVEGRVLDITLSYTYVDPGDGTAVVIPNQSSWSRGSSTTSRPRTRRPEADLRRSTLRSAPVGAVWV